MLRAKDVAKLFFLPMRLFLPAVASYLLLASPLSPITQGPALWGRVTRERQPVGRAAPGWHPGARLTVAIGLINTWNRLAIGFRYTHPVGARKAA
jgi:hypothetical protein